VEISRKNKIFIEKVLYHFDFLLDLGYEISKIEFEKIDDIIKNDKEEYKELNDSLNSVEINLINNNIEFNISFHNFTNDNTPYNYIGLCLFNNDSEGWGYIFELSKYLKKYKPNYNRNKLNYFKLEGEFEERLDKIILELKNILKEDLYEVLIRTKWYNDCFYYHDTEENTLLFDINE